MLGRSFLFSHIDTFSLEEAYGLVCYLAEKEIEDKLFFRWAVGFQDQMSFDEFKEELTPVRKKTDEEIVKETMELFKE